MNGEDVTKQTLLTTVKEALDSGASVKQLMGLMPESTPGKQAKALRAIVLDLMNSGDIDPKNAVIASPERGYSELSYTDVLERFNALIKRDTSPVKKTPHVALSERETTIVVGDLHIPEHRHDFLMEIAKRHEGARLIIGGDLMDFARFSKFSKKVRSANTGAEQRMSTIDILKTGTAVVDSIRPYFSDIVIKRGNHDERLAGMLSQILTDGAELADYLYESMFADMPNVSLTSTSIMDYFMVKRGDAWIGHWDHITGKVPNRGANESIDWMLDNDYIKQFGEWNVLVQLHTHKTSFTVHRGKLSVECGCLSKPQDYSYEKPGRFMYPRNGYFEMVQYSGITDWEESGVRLLRDESPSRKLKCIK